MLIAELNQTRRLGCEFEFVLPQLSIGDGSDARRTFAEILTANGLRAVARSYGHLPVPADCDWAVEFDSSVRGTSEFHGIRWVSLEMKTRPLMGMDDWERVVPKALAIARYLGGRVNASTGHHIHVEATEVRSDPTIVRSLYNVVHRYEPLILGLLAPSRRANQYAMPLPDRPGLLAKCKSLECFRDAMGFLTRYYGLNVNHLWGVEPRVEYRWHQGTLDVEKARHWARFVLRLTDHAVTRDCRSATKQLANERANLDKMLISIGLKVNTRVYAKVAPELRGTGRHLLARWKHFHNGGAPVGGEA